MSVVLAAMLVLVAVRGLGLGKWFSGFGGVAQILTYVALIVLPLLAIRRGTLAVYRPFATEMPEVSLCSLNIFGKMVLGAMSGFEFVALMAGEAKRPERTIPQSVMIATPLIALMFILGTATVLAFVPRDEIDLVSPIPQTLRGGRSRVGRGSVHRAPSDRPAACASGGCASALDLPDHRRAELASLRRESQRVVIGTNLLGVGIYMVAARRRAPVIQASLTGSG